MGQGAAEGIAIGIGEGLGELGGRLRERKQEAAKTRDEQADALTAQIKSIADNIQRVGGKASPDAAPLIQQLEATVKQHNDLFPPHEAPMLLQRLQTLMGHKPGQPKPDPRAGMTADTAMATSNYPEYSTTDAYKRHQNELSGEFAKVNAGVQQGINEQTNDAIIAWGQKRGLSEDMIKDLTATLAGVPATVMKPQTDPSGNWEVLSGTMSSGAKVTLQRSKRDGSITDLAGRPVEAAALIGFIPDPKTAPKNKQAWIIREGKPLSVMLDPQNHPIPGTENPDAVPPPSLFGRITTTDFITDDGFGNIISIPKTTTSQPLGVGGQPQLPGTSNSQGAGAGAPKPFASPGEARAAMQPPAAQRAGPTVVGSKATASQKEAQTTYDKALGMVKLAEEAMKNPSALTDKNLAISLAREASGRFSIAEYDIMIRNAGLANSFEQWMNNLESGKLTDNIRNQLSMVAKNNAAAAKASLDAAGHAGGAGADAIDDEILNKLNKLPVR